MKKGVLICLLFLIAIMSFAGCTPKEKKTENTHEQFVSPHIDYEIPDKANDYDFDIQFVPENE